MEGVGLATFRDRGVVRTGEVAPTELASLEAALEARATLAALRDPSPCAAKVVDQFEWVRVQFVGEALLAKEITGCEGDPYERVRTEATTILERTFGETSP